MPGSLYFIGFTGGLLSVGAVGVIAGPLLVALLSESITLLSEERDGGQTTLDAE
jgi:predicted PurR-regulated permease PerM